MHSFIILGKDAENVKEKCLNLVQAEGISKFDVYTQASEKTIGIPDIRNISKQVFLKPMKGEKKAIVLEAFMGMTIDSQNAFLKILEEPPLSTIIVILANENYFLPTILSRCKLIELDKGLILEENEQSEFVQILEDLQTNNLDKLKLAQDKSKDKTEALLFIEKLIVAARFKMINESKSRGEYKKIIDVLSIYYKEIKQSNVNLRLGLENLFLEI